MSETQKIREIAMPYCIGNGIDLGYGGDKIIDSAISLDMYGDPNYRGDASHLPFKDRSFDYVYSSHLLEDFENTTEIITEWIRVLKIDGYLILYLPNQELYEKYCLEHNQPTNPNHKVKMSYDYLNTKISELSLIQMELIEHHSDYSFFIVYKKINEITKKLKYLAGFGGGLGDVFNKLYEYHQYQVLPLTADRAIIDCVVTCCNPAVKSILSSWVTENGNPILRDIFYRDLFFDNAEMVQEFKDKGYLLLDESEGRDSLFALSEIPEAEQYGYFRRHFYNHKFQLTYQEQTFFDSLPETYIVIHPSGGLQAVDGLTRQEYAGLILRLLDTFPDYHFITIGADHRRDFGNEIDCSGCENTVKDNMTCLKDDSRICVRYKEDVFDIEHPRFIDLTNKTSGSLCANIVQKASGFIGSHSAWMNMFWHFNKPTVCVLSNNTSWGDAQSYVLTNGCRWGFSLPQSAVVPVIGDIGEVYENVIKELEHKMDMIKTIGDIKKVIPEYESIVIEKDDYAGLMQLHEVDTLVSLGKAINAKRIFEFGTNLGHTTRILSQNFDEVWTLDFYAEMGSYISPQQGGELNRLKDVGMMSRLPNVHQMYGDTLSKETRLLLMNMRRSFDLVFVDAGHSLLNVLNDSLLALAMVKRGGLIVWHDFKNQDIGQEVIEAVECINEIKTCWHIEGTWLGFCIMIL